MKTAPRIIGVSGYAQVGKSTFAQALVECEGYVEHSFAQPIKDMLYALNPSVPSTMGDWTLSVQDCVNTCGWEAAKKWWPEIRRLLQALGTDAGRGLLGEDIWVDTAMDALDDEALGPTSMDYPYAVFADVRFPNEAEAIRARGGIIVNIERPGVGPLDDHASENSMEDIEFDYVIHNDGTIPELRQRAMDLIAKETGTYDWYGEMRAIVDRQLAALASLVPLTDPFDVARKFTPDRYQGTEL